MPPQSELPAVMLATFGEGELLDLDDRTAHILRMRSGMVDGQCSPLREIGEELDLGKERVRQIQNQGLAVIRQIREVQRHIHRGPVIRAQFRWRTFG